MQKRLNYLLSLLHAVACVLCSMKKKQLATSTAIQKTTVCATQ